VSDKHDVEKYIDEYSQLAASILIAHGVSASDVPDIMQDLWTFLLSHPPSDGMTAASSVTRIAQRLALQWIRRTGREFPAGLLSEVPAPLVDHTDFDDLGLGLTDDDLIEAIRRLPTHCQVLLFALLGGLPDQSYEELSKGTGIGVASIGPTRMRCLQRLRADLTSRFGPSVSP
jgi:DNA-directed RNA polymerase specialized sigma24 family protein